MNQDEQRNPLYPVFFKLHEMKMLIVGAGEVGYEKLSFILKSSPDANITVVATWVADDVIELLQKQVNPRVNIIERPFESKDIDGHDIVIAATNIKALNAEVHAEAKKRGKMVNVADTPELCDFYMGSIVTRGPLKVGISTNGLSPTFAKRFRQMLEAILPEETEQLIEQLHEIRNQMEDDFSEKVKKLNAITATLVSNK